MDDRERHQQGMKIRREVLGNDHVDRTLDELRRPRQPEGRQAEQG